MKWKTDLHLNSFSALATANGGDTSEVPLFLSLKQELRRRILVGEYGQGQQLPPEPELCKAFNMSRVTVKRALLDLVGEGLLVRGRGRGTFVQVKRDAKLIGIISSELRDLPCIFSRAVEGATDAAARRGYRLQVFKSEEDPRRAFSMAVELNAMKAAGTIYIPLHGPFSENPNADILNAMVNAGQKVVLLDTHVQSYESEDRKLSCVSSDPCSALAKLVEYIASTGRKRIAFLTGPKNDVVIARENAFLQTMEKLGLEVPPEYLVKVAADFAVDQGVQEVDMFMAMRNPPEAIVCLYDLIALNVIQRCAQRGWKVPAEVAVAGFDDIYQAQVSTPALTTVRQPMYEMGQAAVDKLIDQLEGIAIEPVDKVFPCELVIRESCGGQSSTQNGNRRVADFAPAQ